jgi:DivIVA domain-containing protein
LERDSIDRIRTATFPLGRRGYEKREVDRFLGELADWLETGGDDEARADLVRRDLDRIAKETGAILSAAHDAGESLRTDARAEAERVRADSVAEAKRIRRSADAYAKETRTSADGYARETTAAADAHASEVREAADHDAAETLAAARAEAKRIVDEANRHRRDVETVIGDLEARRDAVVGEIERLSSELAGAATLHRPSPTDGQARSTRAASK